MANSSFWDIQQFSDNGGIPRKLMFYRQYALKMANFRYWGFSIENNISWMQGSENRKFQIWGYTYKSHVLQIVLSENGKFRYYGYLIENMHFMDVII